MKRAAIISYWVEDSNGDIFCAVESLWTEIREVDPSLFYVNLHDSGQENVYPDPNIGLWYVDAVDSYLLDAIDEDVQERAVILWVEEI